LKVRGGRGLDGRPSLRFAASWLDLRENLDRAARDRSLPEALANRLPKQPRLLDLGAGTGSLFRFMAPIVGRPQSWIFADADVLLLETALDRTAEWARRRGFAAVLSGGSGKSTLTLHSLLGKWRIETLATDLDQVPHGLPLDRVDAVVCSALLDLTSRAWMERLFAVLRTPFYAGMTVDGRDTWLPRHPADLAVQSAFRADQRRNKGLGPALGNDAADTALRLLTAKGFRTCTATSDWCIGRRASDVTSRFVQMTAQPARQAMPAQARKFTEWAGVRQHQAMKARLAIRVGHRDILAFPSTG
jgi:SAM-dependent methyltransferase